MTKLLEEAIDRLRELPDAIQDSAARALITQLEEEPEPADLTAIAEGRRAYERGEFISLEQWRHDMGLRSN
jgi:predicted transcriptional regulator